MLAAKLASRTNQDWYKEAERTYSEKHQGCPWCGGSYRVFCQNRGSTTLFYCQGCDFQVTRDADSGECRIIPGVDEAESNIPETMCSLPKTLSS